MNTIQTAPHELFTISLPSSGIKKSAQQKIDNKTKPIGSLGILEQLAVKMSTIQNNLNPTLSRKVLFTFASDHGIAEEGVSAFPQEVTAQMVENFLNGGAAINVLCNHNQIELSIIDVGVKSPVTCSPDLISRPVAAGTKNFYKERAMTMQQAYQSVQTGIDVFNEHYEASPIDIIGLGEMGIANTTSAAAIISAITSKSAEECTGYGTGITHEVMSRKVLLIKKALELHMPKISDGYDVLSAVGGFEIGAMAGVVLAAASKGCAVVLDGLISTAAGLIAYTINPMVSEYCIAGHKSIEQGHIYALEHMGLIPVLDLQFRLGEGTGAALGIDIVDAACAIMRDMASFDEAQVSTSLDL